MSQLAQLAEALGVTDRTIRRAVADGLVRVDRRGPRRAHVTVGERRYLARAWPLISTLRRALRTEPSVRLAVLFGSVARGDDRADSDIDLAVALRGHDHGRPYEVQERLSRRLDRDVQVLDLARAEREPELLAEILHDGRVLVDRDKRWPALHRREAAVRRAAAAQLKARTERALERIAALPSDP